MRVVERNGMKILYPDFGHILYSKTLDAYSSVVYLGKYASVDDYEEVEDEQLTYKLDQRVTSLEDEYKTQSDMIDINMLTLGDILNLLEPILILSKIYMDHNTMNTISDLYKKTIQRGLKTIDEIPEKYKTEVQNRLTSDK